jgi:phage regulator Rha-like protein
MAGQRDRFPKRRPHLEDGEEVQSPKPGVPENELDPLWSIYGVNPGLPFRTKVEQLMLIWNLPLDDIASALKEPISRVQGSFDELNEEWMRIGEGLTESERQLARGKLIKELMRMKSELDMMGPTQDAKVIQMKMNLIERLAKLQGLDTDKPEVQEDDSAANPIEEAMKNLTPEQRRALLARLKGQASASTLSEVSSLNGGPGLH